MKKTVETVFLNTPISPCKDYSKKMSLKEPEIIIVFILKTSHFIENSSTETHVRI